MKKTLRTVITAAMFAAANMAALPALAEEQKSFEGVSQSKLNRWEDITGQMGQMVYGPGPNYDLNDHSNDWKQTTTTTMDTVTGTTTTTTYKPAADITQTLYGVTMPRYARLGLYGDVNMDDVVDSFDMIALRKMLISGKEAQYQAANYADTNQDGTVNLADLILLQRYLLGQINDLDTGNVRYRAEIEQITEPTTTRKRGHFSETTTTTASIYDPREDIVVSLYGIKPAKDIIDQAVWKTKEDIDINLSSEDE